MLIKHTLAAALPLLQYSDLDFLRIYFELKPIKDPDPVTGAVPTGSAGLYKRHFVTVASGAVRDELVDIPRIRYEKDGVRSSHAVILDVMKAHSSYSLRFVLTMLFLSLFMHYTDARIHDAFGISTSTLHRWKALFHEHSAEWISALEKADKLCHDIISARNSVPPGPFVHLLRTGLCLMQGKWLVRRAFPSDGENPAQST